MDVIIESDPVGSPAEARLTGQGNGAEARQQLPIANSPGEVSSTNSTPGPHPAAAVKLEEVPLELIDIGENVRSSDNFDEKDEEDFGLVRSIASVGNLQPCLAQKKTDGRYSIIVGGRRLMAARAARCEKLHCVVTDASLTAEEVIEKQLTENYHRKPMSAMDVALALSTLKAKLGKAKEVAARLGIRPAQVSEYLLLLRLQPSEQETLRRGEMTFKDAVAKAKEQKGKKGRHAKLRTASRPLLARNEESRPQIAEVELTPEVIDSQGPSKQEHNTDTPDDFVAASQAGRQGKDQGDNEWSKLGWSDRETGIHIRVCGPSESAPCLDNIIAIAEKWVAGLRIQRGMERCKADQIRVG